MRPSARSIGVVLAMCAGAFAVGCGGGDSLPPGPALFAADYAATYTQVRNCRQSGDHDLNTVRVLADPIAMAAYSDRTVPFPVGATVLKEEYDFGDTACAGPIKQFTVMQKRAVGSAPDLLDWRWQRTDADFVVVEQDAPRCANCHRGCGVPPDGYDGTCTVP